LLEDPIEPTPAPTVKFVGGLETLKKILNRKKNKNMKN